MKWSEILNYIEKEESPSLKFISRVYHEDDLGPAVTALANTRGGKIFIGIDTINCHLIGTDLDRKSIENICKNSCTPDINAQIDIVSRNEKNIMCITIPEGDSKP